MFVKRLAWNVSVGRVQKNQALQLWLFYLNPDAGWRIWSLKKQKKLTQLPMAAWGEPQTFLIFQGILAVWARRGWWACLVWFGCLFGFHPSGLWCLFSYLCSMESLTRFLSWPYPKIPWLHFEPRLMDICIKTHSPKLFACIEDVAYDWEKRISDSCAHQCLSQEGWCPLLLLRSQLPSSSREEWKQTDSLWTYHVHTLLSPGTE
jgi:hypothetical protein